jgi:hypothetical protein
MELVRSFNSDPDFISVDATPVTVLPIPIPQNNTCVCRLVIVARGFDDGTSAAWQIDGVVKRVNDGVTIVGGMSSPIAAQKDAAAALWDVSLDGSGNNLNLTVTGDAFQSVGWFITWGVRGFTNKNMGSSL